MSRKLTSNEARAGERAANDEFTPENLQFLALELSSTDLQMQTHSLIYYSKGLSGSREEAERIVLSNSNLVATLIGFILYPTNEEILNLSTHCLKLITDLNLGTEDIESPNGLKEKLMEYISQGSSCINDALDIICYLFSNMEIREDLIQKGLIDLVKSLPSEVDTSKIITLILRYVEMSDDLVPFVEAVFSWLSTEDLTKVAQAFTILSDLLEKAKETPELQQFIDVDAVHNAALHFIPSEDPDIVKSGFRVLTSIHTMQESDLDLCISCIESNSNLLAKSACIYLKHMTQQWLEIAPERVAKAIIGSVENKDYSSKRTMLDVLVLCLPALPNYDEDTVNIFCELLSEREFAKTAIQALYLIAEKVRTFRGNEWFTDIIEQYADEITEYTTNPNEEIAQKASELLELLNE